MKNPYDSSELKQQRKYLEEIESYLNDDLSGVLKKNIIGQKVNMKPI